MLRGKFWRRVPSFYLVLLQSVLAALHGVSIARTAVEVVTSCNLTRKWNLARNCKEQLPCVTEPPLQSFTLE